MSSSVLERYTMPAFGPDSVYPPDMKGKPPEMQAHETDVWLAGASGVNRIRMAMNCSVHPCLPLQYEECFMWGEELNEDNHLLQRPKPQTGQQFLRETYIQSYESYRHAKRVLKRVEASFLNRIFTDLRDDIMAREE